MLPERAYSLPRHAHISAGQIIFNSSVIDYIRREERAPASRPPVHKGGLDRLTRVLLDVGSRINRSTTNRTAMCVFGCFLIFPFFLLFYCSIAVWPTCFTVCFFADLPDHNTKSASTIGPELGSCILWRISGVHFVLCVYQQRTRWPKTQEMGGKHGRKRVEVSATLLGFKPFRPHLPLCTGANRCIQ